MPDALERIVSAPAKDEEFAKAAAEAMKFESMVATPAWLTMKAHVEKVIDQTALGLAKSILSGVEIDQREVDRIRGYLDGMKAIMAFPAHVESRYDRFVERAWRKALYEGEPEQEDTHGISP